MLDNTSASNMAKNYSHCPLKKRPVPVIYNCSGMYFKNIICISFKFHIDLHKFKLTK